MAIKIKLFLIYTLVVFVLASCSIEKREHLSGYNVEWKKQNHKKADKVETEFITEEVKETDGSNVLQNENELASATIDDRIQYIEPSKLATNNPEEIILETSKEDSKTINTRVLRKKSNYKKEHLSDDPEPTEDKITLGFGITGMVLGILGVFFGFTGPLAIVFSAISLKKYKSTSKYSNGMAIIGLVLGVIFTIFLSIIIGIALTWNGVL
jgi:hypothetical protein